MAGIRMQGLVKRYGPVMVIPSLDLEIRDQEFVVFVGPSGCGKSTLLRIIAGLEPIDGGDIHIGETRVNDMAPAQRDIAMVFQDYALYPHMSVYENMAFGLRNKKTAEAEIKAAIDRAAGMLGLHELLQRKPKQLSGGQQQRVALGRCIVRNPQVFLFDEPLSNLDAKLRAEVRTEIKALSQQLKTTMVFVTHDQVEAMTMADRIVILKAGVVQQMGTPQQVYQRPANRFVAGFMGSPTMNFFDVVVAPEGGRLHDGTTITLPPPTLAAALGAGVRNAVLGVRPEHLRVVAGNGLGLRVEVSVVEPLGSDTLLYFDSGGGRHVARVAPELHVLPGDSVTFEVAPGKAHLFQTGEDGDAIA